MKNKILSYVIQRIVESFLTSLSAEQIKRELDRLVDRVEFLITDSSNTLDDSLLPVLNFIRDVFDVTDYPDKQS